MSLVEKNSKSRNGWGYGKYLQANIDITIIKYLSKKNTPMWVTLHFLHDNNSRLLYNFIFIEII